MDNISVSVNPTCVGMNRIHTSRGLAGRCKPHMCGDEPRYNAGEITVRDVNPTCVGMNRSFYNV